MEHLSLLRSNQKLASLRPEALSDVLTISGVVYHHGQSSAFLQDSSAPSLALRGKYHDKLFMHSNGIDYTPTSSKFGARYNAIVTVAMITILSSPKTKITTQVDENCRQTLAFLSHIVKEAPHVVRVYTASVYQITRPFLKSQRGSELRAGALALVGALCASGLVDSFQSGRS